MRKQFIRSSFVSNGSTNLQPRSTRSAVRLGPSKSASIEFSTSEKVTALLVTLITEQEPRYNVDNEKLKEIKAKIRSDKDRNQKSSLKKDLSPSLQRALDLAKEKGAST